MRRRLVVLWLMFLLGLPGLAGLCVAQDSTPLDIPLLTRQAEAGYRGAMLALGEAYLDGNGVKRDLDKAVGWFTPLARTNDADALYLLSFALRERGRPGDLDEALRNAVTALSLTKKRKGQEFLEANIQSQLGFIYEKLGRFDETVVAYEAARRIFEERLGQSHPQVAGAYMNLANGLAGAGRQEESLAATETAIRVISRLPGTDQEPLGSLYLNKAVSLISLARYGEALAAVDQAEVVYQQLGAQAVRIADVLRNRSRVLNLVGRNQEAIEAAQGALTLYGQIPSPDQSTLAATHGILGLAYRDLRRYDDARAQFRAAATIIENNPRASRIDMMHPLINLGNVDDELREFESALTNYQQALSIILDTYGPDHAETAGMLSRIGNTSLKLKRYDAALEYGLQALLIQTSATDADVDNERYTYRMLARTLSATGNRTTAIFFAKQAVNTHQEVRARNSNLSDETRAALGQSFQPSYRLLSDLLLADGQFSEAQFVAGLLKQQEFYEFTRGGAGRSSASRDIEPGSIRLDEVEQSFWTDMRASMEPVLQIASEMRALKATREETGTALLEDKLKMQELAAKRDQAMQVFVASARNLIDRTETAKKTAVQFGQRYADKIESDLRSMSPNTVLLQIMSQDNNLHVFIRAAGRQMIYRMLPVGRTELANKVSAALAAVRDHDEDALAQLAALYDDIIRPVRSDLDAAVDLKSTDAPVLLLDLSGFLRYVPFAALYDGRRYLVEDFAPALYNPASPTSFTPMRRDRIKGAGFGVTRPFPGFAALPGTARELETVFKIIAGKPRLDDDFTQKSLAKALSSKPQILHIASHFRFRPGNEANSYLLLGNGDGLSLDQLRSQKQYNFRGIDLITLSACETALGGGAEGEEIESFGVLAQNKGASAVMSTLWQIADESTAKLMADFYEGLINQNLDKARALRQAQLDLIQGAKPEPQVAQASRAMTALEDTEETVSEVPTAHPYYWAAFILMGNWM
ncbi:CHAT domain-containing protein [Aestuariivirga sp. YIM B02566]|uniref:CHAT domain-containing protein n=1 Tax=Taklimakanibacter albus TaxID=2800327 RepID=A0ACC5R5A2_9HYPH|nr:CHAT domain-containing protein [Aestuariivirga sp. YIM B02566]MBK1867829.1 CHAT domain-containing protein [Aestuariivirga sp. YIM B02566]